MSSFNELLNKEMITLQAILLDELAVLQDIDFDKVVAQSIYNYAINLCIELEYRIPRHIVEDIVEDSLIRHYDLSPCYHLEYDVAEIAQRPDDWVESQLSEITEQFDLALSQP